ncbi:MAG: geranyl transferase, partial [Kiritimatiellae bacterium]|nr:geranyl transferase [Kiritimatiellia bacterium]
LTSFADGLGMAFQITDDLLDADESTRENKGELSCLRVMSVEDARAWAASQTATALAALQGLPGPQSGALTEIARLLLSRRH